MKVLALWLIILTIDFDQYFSLSHDRHTLNYIESRYIGTRGDIYFEDQITYKMLNRWYSLTFFGGGGYSISLQNIDRKISTNLDKILYISEKINLAIIFERVIICFIRHINKYWEDDSNCLGLT